jgi:hypothetical protein
VKSTSGEAVRLALNGTIQPLSGCIAVERFAEGVSQAERDHIAGCVRCQKEAALWSSLNDPAPRRNEEADVQWIVSELKRRNAAPSGAAPAAAVARWLPWRPLSAIAAALVIAVALGYAIRNREPQVTGTDGPQIYRGTQRLRLSVPLGDQAEVPRQFEWIGVDGAAKYDIAVLEVDRSELWRGSTNDPRHEIPPSVTSRLLPGKTVLWQVVASDSSGRRLASSDVEAFRVVPR